MEILRSIMDLLLIAKYDVFRGDSLWQLQL